MHLLNNYRLIFLLLPVLCIISQTSTAAVIDTDCTPADQTNGDTKCQVVDTNAECPANNGNKCACKTGYKVDPQDDTKCLQIAITQVVCSPGTSGDTKCKGLDANSECPSGATKCACKTGYTGTDTCTKIPITQVGCSPRTSGDTKCKGLDANSECPSGATKCACKTGYTGTDTCSKESSANSTKAAATMIAMSILILVVGSLM